MNKHEANVNDKVLVTMHVRYGRTIGSFIGRIREIDSDGTGVYVKPTDGTEISHLRFAEDGDHFALWDDITKIIEHPKLDEELFIL